MERDVDIMRSRSISVWLLCALMLACHGSLSASPSQCYGTVSRGRIEGSVRLPAQGPNFSAYSGLAVAAGRTHVHAKVAAAVLAAYAALRKSSPELNFVYGETGWRTGGRFKPHRTHQNGLSVDFFVPVRDAAGRSVPLPTGLGNRLGYDIEFDAAARYLASSGQSYSIDFAAMSEHLYELHRAAKTEGLGLSLTIFDGAYLPRLLAGARGAYLRQHLVFMKGKPWVRHDEHYHVDFSWPCKRME